MDLYFKKTCPYCKKVIGYITDERPELMKYMRFYDIANVNNRNNLIKLGGKAQVPFLVSNNNTMYESDDIIAFLSKL